MPHFGLTHPIDSFYLNRVVNLAPGRPVFLLTATDNSHVVIKQEVQVHANDAQNLRFALKAVKTVSPGAAGKPLTPAEVLVLSSYVETCEGVAAALEKPIGAEVVYLRQLLLANGVWYKMDKADGLVNIEDAKAKALNGDKSDVRNIAAALSAPDGLEALGRIIAADLWSGNNDRFTPGGTGGEYRVCQNPGNVLLSVQGAALKPIGLDAYEAMGVFRNYQQPIANLEGADTWGGRLLASTPGAHAQLRRFCTDVIADIEDILGPRNRRNPLGRRRRLPSNAVTRLQHGVVAGSLPIKAKMRQLAGRPHPPVGLIDRLTVVGWWP
jgi:hypothetical protein